jgi:Niemann-Pick C1 protein
MGGQYQANFMFEKPLVCGEPSSDVRISAITFRFNKFVDRDEYLPAKKLIEKIVSESNITAESDHVFLWAKIFGTWITDEIIDDEILRNISLALIGVFFCTAVMIVNLQVCVYIFCCVLLSLVSRTMVKSASTTNFLSQGLSWRIHASLGLDAGPCDLHIAAAVCRPLHR